MPTKTRVPAVLATALVALTGCGGGGGGGSPNTIDLRGGAGLTGAGGSGGGIPKIFVEGGSLTLTRSGGLPALPSWQAPVPDLGANPRTIAADEALSASGPLVGDDGSTAATGVWVKKGATLTLTPASGSTAGFMLPGGLLVDGTIVLAPLPSSRTAASFGVMTKVAAVHGTIRAVGGDGAAGENGGDGGAVTFILLGGLHLDGSIVSTGGGGDAGGNGGAISVQVLGPSWGAGVTPGTLAFTGRTDSSGGVGRVGAGGQAGSVEVAGYVTGGTGTCNAYYSGRIVARGGDGATGGGDAAPVKLNGCLVGWAASVATVDASGGAATANGKGGNGGAVQAVAADGTLYLGGELRARGGAGAGAGGGGDGGQLLLGSVPRDLSDAPALGVHVAARLDAAGGAGADGGAGGTLGFFDRGTPTGTDAGITLAGYDALDASGGDGVTGGGAGGTILLGVRERYDATANLNHVGAVSSDVDLVASGGGASAGPGGDAGRVVIGSAVHTVHPLASPETVRTTVTGALLARGGRGTTAGGKGGTSGAVSAATALVASGPVDVSGGAGGSDAGGAAGGAAFQCSDGATTTGRVTAVGGESAKGSGGTGGEVLAQGASVSLGPVTADGGAAPKATGGQGGSVTATSSSPPSTVTGTISVRGGAGATAGAVGWLELDGNAATLTDGRYSP